VIVHDYVTQRGGAERVALDLLSAFPGSRLVTSFWDRESSFPEFAEYEIETLGPNHLGFFRRDPRRALPLLARTFANHTIDADLVICSSSGWSHRVNSTGHKLVYCHNPARWLYQPDDYFDRSPQWVRGVFARLTNGLRTSDLAAAHSASMYLVNSSVVGERVRERYGIGAEVLAPARGLSVEGPIEPVVGIAPGFLLTIGRDRTYKNIEAVSAAARALPNERLVVVGDTAESSPDSNITSLTAVTDAQMRWLYTNALALVAVAFEDFGLTAIEAQTFGVPAILLRRGGYLDSAVEGVTAVFIDDPGPDSIVAGISRLRSRSWDHAEIQHQGERYRPAAFAESIRRLAGGLIQLEDTAATATVAADFGELVGARAPHLDLVTIDKMSTATPERRAG
jgi:glycosyltransferase involved in cell wall biosynthesis